MKTKELSQIRNMSIEEIRGGIDSLRLKMLEFRMKKIVAPIKDVHLLRGMRKDLATMLTVLAVKVKGSDER
jgi:ribosomal protein L29